MKVIRKRKRELKKGDQTKTATPKSKNDTLHSLNYPNQTKNCDVRSDKKNPFVFNVIMENNNLFLISDFVKMFELMRVVFFVWLNWNRLIISFWKVNSIIFSILLLLWFAKIKKLVRALFAPLFFMLYALLCPGAWNSVNEHVIYFILFKYFSF